MQQKEDNDWVKKCMEYEVEGSRSRGRPRETWREIVEKTVRHINCTGRMPWILKDGGSKYEMIDDRDQCEWVNVSSGNGSHGLFWL